MAAVQQQQQQQQQEQLKQSFKTVEVISTALKSALGTLNSLQ
jgi:hypothetical protein